MEVYGYCCGNNAQDANRQKKSILAVYPDLPKDHLYIDYPGKPADEHGVPIGWRLVWMRAYLGHKVVFDTIYAIPLIDIETVFDEYATLAKRGATLEFLREPYINTAIYGPEIKDESSSIYRIAQQQVRIAYYQAAKRHIAGEKGVETKLMQAADAKPIGRPKGTTRETQGYLDTKRYLEKFSKDFGSTSPESDTQIQYMMQVDGCGVSRASYFRYKRKLKEEKGLK